MNPTKKSNFDKAVIYTQILNDRLLLVVDTLTTLRLLNINSLEVENELKFANIHTSYSTKVISFTSNARYFALISQDAKESRLYETKSKNIIATINRHQGDVSCVAIDPKDRYMFSGGEDGITFGMDMKSGRLAFTLPRHIDTVTDIAFSKNANYVATASYDKNIALFSLITMSPIKRLKAHSAPVIKLQFLSDNRLFSIDKKGSAIIWDLNNFKVTARLKNIHDDVTAVVVADEGTFLFLGTKLGYILVYDLTTYEQISRNYIKLSSAVTALNFNETNKELIVATDYGELFFYYIFDGEDKLGELIKQKKYSLIKSHVEKNPLLEYTKYSEIFAVLWAKTVQKAKEYLENSEKDKAAELLKYFMEIPSKKQFVLKLFQEYAEYDKFLHFFKSKKVALAYGLANVHPIYKETKVYKSMESEWERLFTLAKEYLLDPKLSRNVQEILAPYRGISEKTKLIQELMLNVQVYKRFRDAVGQKDFKLSFELVKQNPFLKEYSEYKALMKYSDTLYMKAQVLLGNGDTHAAIKIFRILLDFEDFKDEAIESIARIENKQKFFNAVKEDDMVLAYNLLDEYPDLEESQEGKRLQMLWESDLLKANESALCEDITEIKTVLDKYMKIKSKNAAIANVLSRYYITQLENALKENIDQKIIENGIKNYVLYYGATEQIEFFFDDFKVRYPDSKLNIKSQTEGSLSSWRPSMIVKSILD
ncbi:MAG: hypothetical protein PHO62_01885 [Sulfurimonas sp.]|uniref:hypothetical protein n=1 Tax=Sulfurimonas sp. TaxID=2022749 RepID=UPI0026205050|nr:hypothetical protein [Sulfurimonas sp.]MDD5372157.1 hypothetical protein [Sulfurimonas sp.]